VFAFSGRDVSVLVSLDNRNFVPLYYVTEGSITLSRGVEFVWVIGRSNVGGFVPVSLPPSTVNLTCLFYNQDGLIRLISGMVRNPHEPPVFLRLVFSPTVLGREYVVELFYGFNTNTSLNFDAGKWGTISFTLQFAYGQLRLGNNEFVRGAPFLSNLPKGYRASISLYPEGSDEPISFLATGVIQTLKFELQSEFQFIYTFPTYQVLWKQGDKSTPYTAPSGISEGRAYVSGNVTAFYPPEWVEHFSSAVNTYYQMVVDFYDMDAQTPIIRWELYNCVFRNTRFNINPSGAVTFTTDFYSQNWFLTV